MLNGWQRIQRVPGSSLPSLGTQVTYSPSPATTLNWSTFIGTDDPDPTRRMRYFNNLYGQFQPSPKVSLITRFDVGVQQQAKWSPELDLWMSPVAIGRLALSGRWAVACRGEYYQDKKGVIISTESPYGFKTTGVSANVDYTLREGVMVRLEARRFTSPDPIFGRRARPVGDNFFIVGSIAVKVGP